VKQRTLDHRNLVSAKVQSQRVTVTLFEESPHNYHRIGSSGSNLPCEGLLLGMQAGGHEDPRARSSPSKMNHSELLLYDDTCDIPSHFLQGTLATQRSFSLVGVEVEPDRTEDSRREGRSHRRLPLKRPQGGDGWRRWSSVQQRSMSLVSQRNGHTSRPH
jgi:hypothetical protein